MGGHSICRPSPRRVRVGSCLGTRLIYYMVIGNFVCVIKHLRRCGETHCFPKGYKKLVCVSDVTPGSRTINIHKYDKWESHLCHSGTLIIEFFVLLFCSQPDGAPDIVTSASVSEPAIRRTPAYVDGQTVRDTAIFTAGLRTLTRGSTHSAKKRT